MEDAQKQGGLSARAVEAARAEYGFNEIAESKKKGVRAALKWFISPIALMLFAAAGLSLVLGERFDFYFILVLMLVNFLVGFVQERKADHAIEKLGEKLAVEVRVLRDGAWVSVSSRELVPGDVISLTMGDIIPADVEIVSGNGASGVSLSVNEAALTGESLPQEKHAGDTCYSGAFVALGSAHARVTATGAHTYFGKILISIDQATKRSLLEQDILRISLWLSALSVAIVLVLSVVFALEGKPWIGIITLDLSLIIAGIPISLPTIMTLIISFGVVGLAKDGAIVRRLSALEDLSNITMLLSDKTGTLTRNEITVERVVTYGGCAEDAVLVFAYFTTQDNDRNPVNLAVRAKAQQDQLDTAHELVEFIPFDSARKRSTALIRRGGEEVRVRTGAAQVIAPLCGLSDADMAGVMCDVDAAAEGGYRVVAVARKNHTRGDTHMQLMGLLYFSDTLEADAQETIAFVRDHGITVKMLTGDHVAIAQRIAHALGLAGRATDKAHMGKDFKELTQEEFAQVGAFAGILPTDKYDIVQLAQKRHIVAVTGDGINDLPALKAANVSIAVKNAVDALKSSADLVLTQSGVAVIRDAVIESRKIFARLYTYSVYRISESFRVIMTIAVLGAVYNTYPLQPAQLILLAFLNDIPIISLAFNRVRVTQKPAHIDTKKRLLLSALFGVTGLISSVGFVVLCRHFFHLDWSVIQTLFFLKLTVSGHMLIYVAHTSQRWYKYLPSKSVISATLATQVIATGLALAGVLMDQISPLAALGVWVWSIVWMQVTEVVKWLYYKNRGV